MTDYVKFLREEAEHAIDDGLLETPERFTAAAAEMERLEIDARKIARLLELGDQRLLAGDGPCGGQSAIGELSVEEESELYQACLRIAGEAKAVEADSEATIEVGDDD